MRLNRLNARYLRGVGGKAVDHVYIMDMEQCEAECGLGEAEVLARWGTTIEEMLENGIECCFDVVQQQSSTELVPGSSSGGAPSLQQLAGMPFAPQVLRKRPPHFLALLSDAQDNAKFGKAGR